LFGMRAMASCMETTFFFILFPPEKTEKAKLHANSAQKRLNDKKLGFLCFFTMIF